MNSEGHSLTWWEILLIVLGALALGGVIGAAAILLYIGKGMFNAM
jgi:hypothetical protein